MYLDKRGGQRGVRILRQLLHNDVESLVEQVLNLVLLNVLAQLLTN